VIAAPIASLVILSTRAHSDHIDDESFIWTSGRRCRPIVRLYTLSIQGCQVDDRWPVTGRGAEGISALARPFPPRRQRPEPLVAEAPRLRPNPCQCKQASKSRHDWNDERGCVDGALDLSPESRMPTMMSSLDLSRDGSHSLPSGGLMSPSSKPRNCQDLVVCGAHLPSLRNADTTSLLSARRPLCAKVTYQPNTSLQINNCARQGKKYIMQKSAHRHCFLYTYVQYLIVSWPVPGRG